MNILITGGAGYIGSHTVLALKNNGHHTVILDDFSKGFRDLVFSDELVEGKIHDRELIRSTIKKYSIDSILHFAAFIEAGESMKNPARYFYNNGEGSLALLDAAISSGVKRFIFSSTAALYGFPDSIPITEDSALIPANPYGESKLMTEKVLSWYSQLYGLNYVSLRYFNASGADPEGRTGEKHNPETHLIPIALQAAYGERPGMLINGTNYSTEDGSCIRDYVHVSDLARAHVLALEFLVSEKRSEVFNLGSETGYSVRQVIDIVRKVTGKEFKVEEGPRRPGDPDILIASSKKIRNVLGWKPEYAELETIVSTANNYYKRRMGLD